MVATQLPLCPEILLYLVSSQTPDSQPIQNNIAQLMESPPYWALCWAGGQVLARYILDNPQVVAGKHVVDFGAGSGVVAIAAAMAGANSVLACDCDLDAIIAIEENATLNAVEPGMIKPVTSIEWAEQQFDLIFAADLLYDSKNLPLLTQFMQAANQD